jgi:ureidoacrylate peracid hydrolase
VIIRVEAQPEPVSIETGQSAVLIVDMQNDFGADGGMFARAGMDLGPIQAVIPPIKRVLEATRAAGVPTVYLKMGYHADLSDAGFPGAPSWIKHKNSKLNIGDETIAPNGRSGRILIRDTWNTDIVDELRPVPGDTVVYKTRYSGFFGTDLHTILQEKHIKYLLVVGCTTGVCVESTIRDAMFRDYHCILPADCAAEPGRTGFPSAVHEASLAIIAARFGWVTQSENLIKAISAAERR